MIDYKERARDLRKRSVYAERILWSLLRNRQLQKFIFRRQYVIEPFITDFICLSKKLIIELDGEYHKYQKEYDEDRTAYLELKGYRVIRFSNEVLLGRQEWVLRKILEVLFDPHPTLSR